MARPKKKTDEFGNEWKEKILAMAEVGASDVEIRGQVLGGICHETWARLIDEDKEFSETIKKAKVLCEAWWQSKGRTELENQKFSYTGWYMNMKNRFGWRDKVEQNINANITTGSETLRQAIESLEDAHIGTEEVLPK